MSTYFFDTSVIIDYLRGKEDMVALIDSIEGELTSSYICLAELFEGVYRVKEKDHAREMVMQFFASLTKVFSINTKVAEQFGRIRAELKKQGTPLEDIDILIAATCLVYNSTLITENARHFSRIKDLKLYRGGG